MDAVEYLLPLLYDLDFGAELIVPDSVTTIKFDTWVQEINIGKRNINRLAMLDGTKTIVDLNKQGLAHESFGNFEISLFSTGVQIGVITGTQPKKSGFKLRTIPFEDFAVGCRLAESGIGVISGGKFLFATFDFVRPMLDAVYDNYVLRAAHNLYSNAKPFVFNDFYQIAFEKLLVDESGILLSVDYGCVECEVDYNTVYALNFREDVQVSSDEIVRVSSILNSFLNPMGNRAIIIHNLGEPVVLSNGVKRLEIPQIDFDPTMFFDL